MSEPISKEAIFMYDLWNMHTNGYSKYKIVSELVTEAKGTFLKTLLA
jgi:hypothetical protein